MTGLLKRTQKFIAGNWKFDMNFIYLHVNRICVWPQRRSSVKYTSNSSCWSHCPQWSGHPDRQTERVRVDRDLGSSRKVPPMMPERAQRRQLRALFLKSVWMSRRSCRFMFSVSCLSFYALSLPLFCGLLLLLSVIENRTFFAAFLYHWKCSRIWTGDSGYACMITGLAHWLRSSPTLPCVLLAIMPKIWLTSRLLLFIMIHFARFYGCPAPTAVAQWSLQANAGFNSPPTSLCPRSLINFMRFDHILFYSVSLICLSCGPL